MAQSQSTSKKRWKHFCQRAANRRKMAGYIATESRLLLGGLKRPDSGFLASHGQTIKNHRNVTLKDIVSDRRVGWQNRSCRRQEPHKWAGRRALKKRRSLSLGRLLVAIFCRGYAAVDFFAALACGFGVTFFCADFAFSFAANSCFTLRAMASASTL